MFQRRLDNSIYKILAESNIWTQKIKRDCIDQYVFLALRNNQINFYHNGGRLFYLDRNEFKTHIKYASVITEFKGDYLSESELCDAKLTNSFTTNYDRIKENCTKHTGVEDDGISKIYHAHSYLSDSNVVILDVEVSFESFVEGKTQDIIDILLYNKKERALKFVEAKHYSNGEIWSTKTPKVISQIKRYKKQIKEREEEILTQYESYVSIINKIFDLLIPIPIKIAEEPLKLLIFGYDTNQKTGRLKEMIITNPKYAGINIYGKGSVNKIDMEAFWKVNHQKS